VFLTEALVQSCPSEFVGTESSPSACKITGQESSKHGRNFEETTGDCSKLPNLSLLRYTPVNCLYDLI